MTDREKLIELLKVPIHPRVGVDPAEVVADYLLDNGVTFATDTNDGGKWISVEDEMPHAEYGESDNVLAAGGLGIVEVLYFDGSCWCYPTGEPVFYEDPSWRITHWMPLPEPPVIPLNGE